MNEPNRAKIAAGHDMMATSFCNLSKCETRAKIWKDLRNVALPDSRFDHDYSSFIPDFEGSSTATNLLVSLPAYKEASILFITPDNCLEELRYRALKDGKTVLVTTYGIRRGFWLLYPKLIAEERWTAASMLDGMERFGRHITLAEIRTMGKIDFMITGTGAIDCNGLRFGKGHGYFDLEWGMLYSIGVVTEVTPTAAVAHECQVLDKVLVGDLWDTGCDFVVTNQRIIKVENATKPACGILWDILKANMLANVEPLRELRQIQKSQHF